MCQETFATLYPRCGHITVQTQGTACAGGQSRGKCSFVPDFLAEKDGKHLCPECLQAYRRPTQAEMDSRAHDIERFRSEKEINDKLRQIYVNSLEAAQKHGIQDTTYRAEEEMLISLFRNADEEMALFYYADSLAKLSAVVARVLTLYRRLERRSKIRDSIRDELPDRMKQFELPFLAIMDGGENYRPILQEWSLERLEVAFYLRYMIFAEQRQYFQPEDDHPVEMFHLARAMLRVFELPNFPQHLQHFKVTMSEIKERYHMRVLMIELAAWNEEQVVARWKDAPRETKEAAIRQCLLTRVPIESLGKDKICPICRDSLVGKDNEEEDPVKLPCGHIYDFACVFEWLAGNGNLPSCPMDRTNFMDALLHHLDAAPGHQHLNRAMVVDNEPQEPPQDASADATEDVAILVVQVTTSDQHATGN